MSEPKWTTDNISVFCGQQLVCRLTRNSHDGATIVRAVNSHDELVAALKWLLDDERFQVGVGGNPLVVDRMLAAAYEALAKAEQP